MALPWRTGVWPVVLAGSALLGLPLAAGAGVMNPPPTKSPVMGFVVCRDGTPKGDCALTLEAHDATGVVDQANTVTYDEGVFETTLHCPSANE